MMTDNQTVFYADDNGAQARYCAEGPCERMPNFVIYPEQRFVCVWHAPGTWYERLSAMPTITQGQEANLKYEGSGHRIWLSRLDRADGVEHDNAVEVEVYQPIDGRWTVLGTFDSHQAGADGLFG